MRAGLQHPGFESLWCCPPFMVLPMQFVIILSALPNFKPLTHTTGSLVALHIYGPFVSQCRDKDSLVKYLFHVTVFYVLRLIVRSIKCKMAVLMPSFYNSVVRHHLKYAVQSWSPNYRQDIEKLESCDALKNYSTLMQSYKE